MTDSALTAFLLPVAALVLGVLLGWSWATARASATRADGRDELSRLRAEAASWQARAEELAQRAELAEERSERDGSVLRALAPVRAQLEQVGARVEQMERARAEQHATLSEQIRATARTEQELARTTSALEGALRSRSSRGLWGEVELARVLEASGMLAHIDFSEQRAISSLLATHGAGAQRSSTSTDVGGAGAAGAAAGHRAASTSGPAPGSARPDVVVHLPGGAHLALDAKVPLDSYLKATALQEEAAPGQAAQERHRELMRAHAKALRSHVDALAARHYERSLPSCPELVVLFIPAESILAAALATDPTLMEHALSKGVALTSPASLLALLRTCATAWARTAVNDDAAELLTLGRTLYERLGVVARHLDQLGSALQRGVVAYNRVAGSLESRLLVTARSFETLAQDLPEVRPISPDEAQLRTLSAPELSTSTPQSL